MSWLSKFWKKNKIKDGVHDRAAKLLDEYEVAISFLVSDIVAKANTRTEAVLFQQGVATGIIESVKIPQAEAVKITKRITSELSRLIDRLW